MNNILIDVRNYDLKFIHETTLLYIKQIFILIPLESLFDPFRSVLFQLFIPNHLMNYKLGTTDLLLQCFSMRFH